jgi:uncharacterized RDD family membrane protein YckC
MSDDAMDDPGQVRFPAVEPAAPWRRLAASVIDTGVLLLCNALIFMLAVAIAPDASSLLPLPLLGLVSALAYLAVGWAAWGATVGKWALGIRVVAADGRKLSWRRAVARVPAFLIASAPLKIGLAAMLWDRERRGWHDHLAGTMVVRDPRLVVGERSRAPASSRTPPAPEPEPEQGHSPRERRLAALMLAVYVLAAVALTMPLALHSSTHVPGATIEGLEQDGYVFLWDYWWVKTALADPRLSVMSTRYLFWPEGVSLRYHTLVLLHSAAAALLQDALSLVQTYNLLLVLSLAACAWGAFLLCRYLTGSATAAAVAGLGFGFCPYLTTHALAHQNLIAAEWLAPFAYCALRGLRERRPRYVLGAAASWALVGLCEWYYFLYAGMLLAVFAACEIAARPRRWGAALAAAGAMIALALAGLWPLLGPMLAERAQAPYMHQPLARPAALGAQPELYVTPAFTHPLLGDIGSAVLRAHGYSRAEATLYLGLVVLALALTGIAYRGRRLVPWIAGTVFFLTLALGPYLRIGDRTHFNALALLLAGGSPGNGFDLPFSAELSSQLAMQVAGGGDVLAAQAQVPLPYLWLWKYVPLTRLAAVPTRAALPAMLCLAVLAAAGLAAVTHGWSRRWRVAGAGMAAAAVLFEFLPAPYPLRDVRVPGFYHDLARRDDDFAVAEVPLLGDYAIYMRYQTVHHRPILAGLVSRRPPHALEFVRGNALLRDLQPQRTRPGEKVMPSLPLTQGGALHRDLRELRATYAPALAQLRDHRVGVVVVHTDRLRADDAAALDRVLHGALGLHRERHYPHLVAYYLAPQLAQAAAGDYREGEP